MHHRLSLALLVALACTAWADHIPGHDNDDPAFPVPIPGQADFTGGIAFVTLIGPDAGSQIFNTRFDIHYVSDGVTPASDILLEVGMFIESDGNTEFRSFHLTGADLGFADGPGTFHGQLETDTFNGFAVPGFLPPSSIVHLTIGAIDGGINGTGYFEDSFIYFDLVPIPAPAASLTMLALLAAGRRRTR